MDSIRLLQVGLSEGRGGGSRERGLVQPVVAQQLLPVAPTGCPAQGGSGAAACGALPCPPPRSKGPHGRGGQRGSSSLAGQSAARVWRVLLRGGMEGPPQPSRASCPWCAGTLQGGQAAPGERGSLCPPRLPPSSPHNSPARWAAAGPEAPWPPFSLQLCSFPTLWPQPCSDESPHPPRTTARAAFQAGRGGGEGSRGPQGKRSASLPACHRGGGRFACHCQVI